MRLCVCVCVCALTDVFPLPSRFKLVRGVFFKCQPCLAFLIVCGAGVALILWTQTFVLNPRFSARLDTPKGSKTGTPCLLSRLYDIDCAKMFAANVTYLQEMAARKEWRVGVWIVFVLRVSELGRARRSCASPPAS